MRGAMAIVGYLLLASATTPADPIADYSGPELYKRFCASCHGATGLGDGPVAASLKVIVPDLTRLSARNAGAFPDARVRRIIDGREIYPAHGTRYMPVWGREFAAAEGGTREADAEAQAMIARLADYLHTIQQ